MNDIANTRQAAPSSLTKREKMREWFWYALIILLVLSLFASIAVAASLYQQIQNPGIHRSDDEMISGGKRFIDNFYSLNSATVDMDQFRAMRLMMQKEDQDERMDYLVRTDFVRTTQDAQMNAEIDWQTAKYKIVNRVEGGILDVEYIAHLVTNSRSVGKLDILLTLVPIEKTDTHTDGVGVWNWIDIAENPFEVEDED